jgi:hypothetical protein
VTMNIKVHALKEINIIPSIRCELSRCMDVLSLGCGLPYKQMTIFED